MSAAEKPKAGDARKCKGCGMPIEFRIGPAGRLIPLQRVRSVYAVLLPLHGGGVELWTTPAEAEGIFVSHWETCPNAAEIKRMQGKA